VPSPTRPAWRPQALNFALAPVFQHARSSSLVQWNVKRLFATKPAPVTEAKVPQHEDNSKYITSLKDTVILPNSREAIPTYRVMDEDGKVLNPKELPNVRPNRLCY